MAAEIAVVGISVDTSGVERAEHVTTRTFAKIGDAGAAMSARVQEANKFLDANAQAQQRNAAQAQALGQAQGSLTQAQRESVASAQQAAVVQARLDRLRQMSVGEIQEEVAAILRLPPALRDEEMAILRLVAAQQQLDARRQAGVATMFQRANAERAQTEAWVRNSQRASAAAATVGTATAGSARGARTAQNALNALAISAAGIPGPVGRVASSLGTLALGGVATVAVVGGLSAIVAVLSKLGEESREARRETEELIARLREQARVESGQQLVDDVVRVRAEVERLTEEYNRATVARQMAFSSGYGGSNIVTVTPGSSGQREEAARRLSDAETALQQLLLEGLRKRSEIDQRLADQRKAAAEEARRLFEERQQQVAALAQLEAAANVARARMVRDVAGEERALQAQARLDLEQRIAAQDQLNAGQREQYRQAGLAIIAAEAQARADQRKEVAKREAERVSRDNAQKLEERTKARATLLEGETELALLQAQLSGDAVLLEQARHAAAVARYEEEARRIEGLTKAERERHVKVLVQIDEVKKKIDAQKKAEEEATKRYEAALRTTTDAFQRGFAGIWEHGFKGFQEFFEAVENLAVQAAGAIAAAMAVEALGIDQLLKNLTGPNGKSFWAPGKGFNGRGSFAANVGAGFIGGQIGGQFGASQSSGFGAGAVGGLSGAAMGFAAGGPVGAIVGGVTGIVSGLLGQSERAKEAARRFAEAQKAFDLALQSYVATVAGDQLTQALAANQAQVDQLIAQAKDLAGQRFKQLDLGDLADGDAAGIFADLQQQIDEITAASKQLEEQLKAEHAARAEALGEDLQVRALRAQGLDAEADALALSLAHQRERLALEKELGDQFNATLQAQLAYVQGLELEAAAKAKAEEAARKAAELAERQQYFREDLEVRALAASGDTAGAEALRRRIAYEREYAEAVKAGMDETTLAMLRNVQAAEELAIAQAEAAQKAQDLIDAMNAEARAMENLEVRHYRAIGQHDFAEEARMRFEHEEETRRAIEEGRSDAYMQFLKQTQQEERDAFTKQRQDAQQKAFDDAVRSAFPKDATFLDDKPSVNLAVGVSESTVNRMVGVLQSQLIMQQSLPRIESSNAEAVQLLRAIAVALGGNLLAVVDQGLATMSADSDLAAGVPPGNR